MAAIPKPESPSQNPSQYAAWLSSISGFVLDGRWKNHYESVANQMWQQSSNSPFWRQLTSRLSEIDARYYAQTGYYLLMNREIPPIVWKPFDSALDKSWRKNVLLNPNWSAPPTDQGWLIPDQWFSRMNDVVRTILVVRYLDGVAFLASEIDTHARALNLDVKTDYEARDEGYYAAHVYVTLTAEVTKETWDTQRIDFPFEIQITTQLQESIRPITHPFYVTRRSKAIVPTKPWQWDYGTDEFRANFLAHTLHHVEGLIVDVRDHLRRRS